MRHVINHEYVFSDDSNELSQHLPNVFMTYEVAKRTWRVPNTDRPNMSASIIKKFLQMSRTLFLSVRGACVVMYTLCCGELKIDFGLMEIFLGQVHQKNDNPPLRLCYHPRIIYLSFPWSQLQRKVKATISSATLILPHSFVLSPHPCGKDGASNPTILLTAAK